MTGRPPSQSLRGPDNLRVIGIVLVILGALFKLEHWPGSGVLFLVAWAVTLAAILWRLVVRRRIIPKEAARDLFTLGFVSIVVMRALHLPDRGITLAVTVIGALGVLWYERDRILPGKGGKGNKPWLFYLAMALVLADTVFRIEHWPYGTALLIGGLAMAAIWFFATMGGSREEEQP